MSRSRGAPASGRLRARASPALAGDTQMRSSAHAAGPRVREASNTLARSVPTLRSFLRRGPLHCIHSMRPLPDGWKETIQVLANDLPPGSSPVRAALARWVGGTPCRSGVPEGRPGQVSGLGAGLRLILQPCRLPSPPLHIGRCRQLARPAAPCGMPISGLLTPSCTLSHVCGEELAAPLLGEPPNEASAEGRAGVFEPRARPALPSSPRPLCTC